MKSGILINKSANLDLGKLSYGDIEKLILDFIENNQITSLNEYLTKKLFAVNDYINGKSLLHYAVRSKNCEIIKCLLDHGAKLLPDQDGNYPFADALEIKPTLIIDLLSNFENYFNKLDMFLNKNNQSILELAFHKLNAKQDLGSHLSLIKWLIEYKNCKLDQKSLDLLQQFIYSLWKANDFEKIDFALLINSEEIKQTIYGFLIKTIKDVEDTNSFLENKTLNYLREKNSELFILELIKQNRLLIFEWLVSHILVSDWKIKKESYLTNAIKNDADYIVDWMLCEHTSLLNIEISGVNIAFFAASCGSLKVLKKLYEHKRNLFSETDYRNNTIFFHATKGHNKNVIEWLQETLGQPNQKEIYRILREAIAHEKSDMINWALKKMNKIPERLIKDLIINDNVEIINSFVIRNPIFPKTYLIFDLIEIAVSINAEKTMKLLFENLQSPSKLEYIKLINNLYLKPVYKMIKPKTVITLMNYMFSSKIQFELDGLTQFILKHKDNQTWNILETIAFSDQCKEIIKISLDHPDDSQYLNKLKQILDMFLTINKIDAFDHILNIDFQSKINNEQLDIFINCLTTHLKNHLTNPFNDKIGYFIITNFERFIDFSLLTSKTLDLLTLLKKYICYHDDAHRTIEKLLNNKLEKLLEKLFDEKDISSFDIVLKSYKEINPEAAFDAHAQILLRKNLNAEAVQLCLDAIQANTNQQGDHARVFLAELLLQGSDILEDASPLNVIPEEKYHYKNAIQAYYLIRNIDSEHAKVIRSKCHDYLSGKEFSVQSHSLQTWFTEMKQLYVYYVTYKELNADKTIPLLIPDLLGKIHFDNIPQFNKKSVLNDHESNDNCNDNSKADRIASHKTTIPTNSNSLFAYPATSIKEETDKKPQHRHLL